MIPTYWYIEQTQHAAYSPVPADSHCTFQVDLV